MEKKNYKCVIFDLDGTLLYTLPSINTALNETLAAFGFPTHPLERTVDFVNFGSVELVRRALPHEHQDSETVEKLHEIYLPILKKYTSDGVRPYEGIPEVCRKLYDSGVTLCVMSNKPQAATETCINTHFESGLFKIVRGSVPGKFLKPDKSFSLDVIKSASADISECIFVGDSCVDIDTARNADCPVIWVKWGYGNANTIDNKPDYIAETPRDLLKIIL